MSPSKKDQKNEPKAMDSNAEETPKENQGQKNPENSEEKPKAEETKTKPRRNLPLVPLKVFAKLSGIKPDQIAGFKRFALNEKLGPMTVPQWKDALIAFQNKPMR